MTFRVYSGPRGSEAISPLEKERMLFKEFDQLDGALAWARHVNESGRVALLIDGDDGTHMSRQDIADFLGLTIETVSRTLTLMQGTETIELLGSRRIALRNQTVLRQLNS